MILGLGGLEVKPAAALKLMDPSRASLEFQQLKDQAADLVKRLPSQYEYLSRMR
jgi:tryptophan halogenase